MLYYDCCNCTNIQQTLEAKSSYENLQLPGVMTFRECELLDFFLFWVFHSMVSALISHSVGKCEGQWCESSRQCPGHPVVKIGTWLWGFRKERQPYMTLNTSPFSVTMGQWKKLVLMLYHLCISMHDWVYLYFCIFAINY